MNKDIVTVIKSVNYSEADKVLTIFGREYGKFAVFAKGIRKINSNWVSRTIYKVRCTWSRIFIVNNVSYTTTCNRCATST